MGDQIRLDRQRMLQQADNEFSDLKNFIVTSCLQQLKELNYTIAQQDDENRILQKELTDNKRECSQLQQLMNQVSRRLENLENSVGSYGKKTKSKNNL